jgi:hypothetical protein
MPLEAPEKVSRTPSGARFRLSTTGIQETIDPPGQYRHLSTGSGPSVPLQLYYFVPVVTHWVIRQEVDLSVAIYLFKCEID